NGSFVYRVQAGYTGSDVFTYHASNAFGNSNPATVTLTVTNTAPTAVADSYSVHQGQTLKVTDGAVLANDSDANQDPLTASLVTGPAHGTLALNPDGTFSYTPNANFSGQDAFTYRA